jgi:Arc/MetJ-type ribon-helix-helix transcriptional regulator
MLPMSEKVFVRLTKDLAAALDRYVEKRGQETPGIRLTRSDAIRACLPRSLQEELHELAMRVQDADLQATRWDRPREEV